MIGPEPTEVALRELEEELAARVAELRARRSEGLPRRALAWLALAPYLPVELARRGFPTGDGDALGTGGEVDELLRRLAEHPDVERMPPRTPWREEILALRHGAREATLEEVARTADSRVADARTADSRVELAAVARALLAADADPDAGAGRLALDPALHRWAELARRGGDERALARTLEKRVGDALAAAAEAGRSAPPEALRWIEAAEPIAEVLGGSLGGRVATSLALCRRRVELFYRRVHDRLKLRNHYSRAELDRAFLDLLDDDDRWALHFVGVGGTGKTMLLRHLTLEVAEKVAPPPALTRIDFDYLNPDYPFRAPGLLLTALAEELRLQGGGSAEKHFHRFDRRVAALHDRIASERHRGRAGGAPVTVDDRRFREVLEAFVEALGTLGDRRPVLLLDTCEELAKVRPDGTVPESVRATFAILEALHRLRGGLRVVFAGRRELPAADYLRVHRIGGFTGGEARDFLRRYRAADGGKVRSELVAPILGRTVAEEGSGGAERRHNPYDLDMYASWAAADPELDAEKLLRAGAHHYVKERILGRLTPAMRALFPALTVLGRFDRPLLERLFAGEPSLPSLLDDLGRQEVIQPDRGGAWELWILDPIVRRRLRRYYREEERGPYLAARRRVAELLAAESLERPFSELTPQLFAAALDALAERPREAARWWRRVEERIVGEGEWRWAGELVSVLLEEPVLDPGREVTLRAAVLATQAAVLLHTSEADRRPVWREVAELSPRHPDPVAGRALALRARLALAAAGGRVEPIAELVAEPAPPIWDSELRAACVAMLEAAVEAAEEAVDAGTSLGAELRAVAAQLAKVVDEHEPDAGVVHFVAVLRCRARHLTGAIDDVRAAKKVAKQAMAAWPLATEGRRYLDWLPPDHLPARLWLEAARLDAPTLDRLPEGELTPLREARRWVPSLDADRLLSFFVDPAHQLGRLTAVGLDELLEGDAALHPLPPRCRGHRACPPFAVSWLLAQALDGEVEEGLAGLQRVSEGAESARRHDLVLAADRAIAGVLLRYRLTAERWWVPTSLRDSDEAADRQLAARVDYLCEGIRSPELASDPLDDPYNWQPRTGVGSFLLELAHACLDAHDGNRFRLEERLADLRAHHEQLIDTGYVFPPWPDDPGAAIDGLDRMEEEHRVWRPWWVRLLACRVWVADEDREPLRDRLLAWVEENHGAEVDGERRLPPELGFLRPVGHEPFAVVADPSKGTEPVQELPPLDLEVHLQGHPEDPNDPLASVGAEIGSRSKASRYLDLLVPLHLRPAAERRYAHKLAASGGKAAGWIRELHRELDAAGLVLEPRLIVPEDAAAVPWEALLSLPTLEPPDPRRTRIELRRVTRKRPPQKIEPWRPPVEVLTVDLGATKSDWARAHWDDRRPELRQLGFRFEGVREPWELERDRPEVGVLHLHGTAVETPSGLRIELADERLGETKYDPAQTVLRPAKLPALYPRLRLAVLQLPERLDDDRRRSDGDRHEADLLRRVGAELFAGGVPAVLLVPSIPPPLTGELTAVLAELLASRPRNAVAPLMDLVRQLRIRIADDGHPDREAALELAYDVCLYLDDPLDLRVGTDTT